MEAFRFFILSNGLSPRVGNFRKFRSPVNIPVAHSPVLLLSKGEVPRSTLKPRLTETTGEEQP